MSQYERSPDLAIAALEEAARDAREAGDEHLANRAERYASQLRLVERR
jgi:hypothetical protein